MDEGKKKMIMIVLVVACVAAAVVITIATQSGGSGKISDIKRGEDTVWLKCRNEECGHTWQMDKREFFEYIEKNRMGMTVPAVICPSCGEDSGYQAMECPKCGTIFEKGAVPGAATDKCPECGYSMIEEMRAKRKNR